MRLFVRVLTTYVFIVKLCKCFRKKVFLSGVISPDKFFLPKVCMHYKILLISAGVSKSVADQAPSRVRLKTTCPATKTYLFEIITIKPGNTNEIDQTADAQLPNCIFFSHFSLNPSDPNKPTSSRLV